MESRSVGQKGIIEYADSDLFISIPTSTPVKDCDADDHKEAKLVFSHLSYAE